MRLPILIIALALRMPAADSTAVPSATEVVARMMERDAERQAALSGYTGMRRYTLENKSRKAWMLVRVTVLEDGTKQGVILEEAGSGPVRNHVFRKVLQEEADASGPKLRGMSRFTPENYSFHSAGTDTVNERAAYVLEVVPKSESKYLIAGRIWVDAEEYAVLRVDGKPARNPSFWTRSVHFIHTYQKNGPFWLPASNRSVTDVRIFGRTEMTIEYFDYLTNQRVLSASGSSTQGDTGNEEQDDSHNSRTR